ncbi:MULTISPECIES: DnaA regulatory inactivator Hda [unclassified Methylococcus]|uniref:DnaA regulatory inactivator Hda n=1 Tax=unclassified Methylococcus TaxID=2618889 RepID=UPI003D7F13BB
MAQQIPLHFAVDPLQTFEAYWAGPNAEAAEAARRSARGEGDKLLYLWGDTGLGKTHLVNAACREAFHNGRSAACLPLALIGECGPAVLEGMENQNLVCLDDIDTIAGRDDWERQLFGLFNAMRDAGNTLLITATAPPGELPVALPDLKTRLAWGLVLRLHPLTDEHKLAALERRAGMLGLDLSPRVGRFLLSHCRRDMASLQALLEELDHASLAAKRRLTVPFIKGYLEDIA